ncbi:MAG: hypothetical protein ACI4BA_01415 [Prevotella sp.]
MTTNDGMTNGRVIHIRMGMVNQPIVEDIADEKFMDSAIFGNQYRQILTMLNRHVTYRRKATDRNIDSANNVFTFVGERGSGKTSCMSSVSRLLTGNRLKDFIAYPQLGNTRFETIDIIDPSYFDERHNIVAMVIAKLYKSFSQKEDANSHEKCNFDVHRDLVAAFAQAQKSMRCLLKDNLEDEGADDDIESLADLSMAVDLRNDINRLVELYMKFVKKEDGILLLSIDDIDLNIDEADTMTEQIRKYLVSPNIVILLAAKLDQLATIKNLHYSEKYRYLIDSKRIDYDTVEEMTGQYLVKFAPEDQRVYMPAADFYMESGIEIEGDNVCGTCVKQAIPELIFSRTRYLFYNSKHEASCIVPRNLRKMCQLAAMVWPLARYRDGDGLENKRIFKNYLFLTWTQDNLTNEDRKRARRILEGWKNEQLNRVTLDVLKEKYGKWIADIKESYNPNLDRTGLIGEIDAIYDPRNHDFNMSLGDVMSMIYQLQIAYESYADKCFFFFIESVYSIALYESYDWVTEKMDKPGYDEYAINSSQENKQVLLYDPFSDERVEPYHKMLGGSVFNFRLSAILPQEQVSPSELVSRTNRIIDYIKLNNLITEAVNDWQEYKALEEEARTDERKSSLKDKVRLAEWFMLCCIRDINRRNRKKGQLGYEDLNFRHDSSVYYNGVFKGISSLYFDLGAFFYNVTTMNTCYRRYKQGGMQLLDLCKDDTEECISLYASFRKKALDYRREYSNPHAWMSFACMRNTEIIFDLYQNLKSVQKVEGANNRLYLAQVFKKLAQYSIQTYDRDNAGTYLQISFEFAQLIASLLRKTEIEERFDSVFSVKKEEENLIDESLLDMLGYDKGQIIDIDAVLKRRDELKNKKTTVLAFLFKNEKQIVEGKEKLVASVFDKYGDYMTREEIRRAVNNLNVLLIMSYGKSETNTENTVSQSETAEHPEEPQGES